MSKKIFLIALLFGVFILSVFSQPIDNFELTNKSKKSLKRYIHPKSKYITISGGFGFTATHIDDPNYFLNQGIIMFNTTYVPTLTYEHGVKDNFFVETAYSYIGQGISRKRIVNEVGNGSYEGLYSNHDFQLGLGYRVINANNFNFFNVHGGLFLGFANSKLTGLPIRYGFLENDAVTQHDYYIRINILHFSPISVGPYLGISKEIRLSEEIRFFAKYVYRFGLNSTMKGTMEFESQDLVFNHDATFNVKGGGAFISGGFKVLLFKNKLN